MCQVEITLITKPFNAACYGVAKTEKGKTLQRGDIKERGMGVVFEELM